MVGQWGLFALAFLFLLFLVIYVLDHWSQLNRNQRVSSICNIITMVFVSFTIWLTIEMSMKEMQQSENSQNQSSVFQEYEKQGGKKIYIQSNRMYEGEIEIRNVEKGTKIFFDYSPSRKDHWQKMAKFDLRGSEANE